ALLGLVRDTHPRFARVLTEALDPRSPGGADRSVVGVLRIVGLCERPDHEDLLAIDSHGRRAGEPLVREAAGEPALEGLHVRACSHDFITSLQRSEGKRAGKRKIGSERDDAPVRGREHRREIAPPWRGTGADLVGVEVTYPGAARASFAESEMKAPLGHAPSLDEPSNFLSFAEFCNYGRDPGWVVPVRREEGGRT